MADQFLTIGLDQIWMGEELPVSIYVYLAFRFILLRAGGDTLDRAAWGRLEARGIKTLFIKDKDRKQFETWTAKKRNLLPKAPVPAPATKSLNKVREDLHRKTMDVFQSSHPDKAIAQTLTVTKKLVNEVMKHPYAVQSLSQLQSFSQGTVDHSVNVSVLSVYLAMQMGYSHALILQHVGMGGLLHDVGKMRVKVQESDTDKEIETKMKDHPALGGRYLESLPKVPNEVKMIVAQHHELHDGTGYPKKLRGSTIYDLARIVVIANIFDELVGDGQGSLVDRQRSAIQQIDQVMYKKFDPQKLEKAVKILRLGV